uniref:Uncharacterized protein n=1 Tax=viral metagenome TaxID=1070528 RepID=A0A6C0CV13_9ZZZZ
MKTLTWPYGNNNYYAKGNDDIQASTYFRMNKFINSEINNNNDHIITTYNLSFTPYDLQINNIFSKIFYIDLDEDCTYDETKNRRSFTDPLVLSGKPYTIEITCTLFDLTNSSYQGTIQYDENYFNKSRVFFSVGQNVPGVGGNIFTVGTDSIHSNKKKPVIGLTTKDGNIKSLPTSEALSIEDNKEYTFRLVYNPSGINEEKILLFMKDLTDPTNSFVLQSTGYGLSTIHNYMITKPRLYFYTSGWTNESGWNQTFDYALASFSENDNPIQVSDGVLYPIEYSIEQLNNITYDEPIFTFNDPDIGYDETTTTDQMYVTGDNELVLYIE